MIELSEDEKTALRAWFNREGDLVWWHLHPGRDRETWARLRAKGLAGPTLRDAQLGLSALGIQALAELDEQDRTALTR